MPAFCFALERSLSRVAHRARSRRVGTLAPACRNFGLGLLLLSVGPWLACSRGAPGAATGERELVVFAAASLREAFGALGDDFARSHPGVRVTFNFAGSQELRTQLEFGAVADVFASADEQQMDALVRAGRVGTPSLVARNELVLVVSSEARTLVRGLADLPDATRLVIGAPEVPVGRYTIALLDAAEPSLGPGFRERVLARVVSRELNVRQVLQKVSLGEAQAGFVYRTDALTAGDRVHTLTLPPDLRIVARYPIAVVANARHVELARAFVTHAQSAEGQRVLVSAGFTEAAPPEDAP